MYFYVDGQRQNKNAYLISDLWATFETEISLGTHDLAWEFVTQSSYNSSEIGARIRFLFIFFYLFIYLFIYLYIYLFIYYELFYW
jgi:hypothetical protein